MTDYGDLMAAVAAFDLEGYLQQRGFSPLRGDEWLGPCPHCGKEKCCVDAGKRVFHCWVCQEFESRVDSDGSFRKRPVRGAGGLVALVAWLEEVSGKEAVEHIMSDGCIGDLRTLTPPADPDSVELRDEWIAPPEFWTPIREVLPYMARRGVTMEDVDRLGLFWCPYGKYRNRLVFPAWERGKLLYWQARAMYEQSECPSRRFIKALNPPAQPGAAVSTEVLFNLDQAAACPRPVLVEGPMDVVRTGPAGIGTWGKQISIHQVMRMRRAGITAVDLMWDGPTPKEPAGAWPEMRQFAPWLSIWFDVRLVFLPSGDPADWTREALDFFRSRAEPAGHASALGVL